MTSRTPRPDPQTTAHGELMSALLDGMADAACVVDAPTLRIVCANSTASQALLGEATSDLTGRDIQDFAVSPEDQFFWLGVSALGTGEALPSLHSDSYAPIPGGGVRPVERRIAPLSLPGGGIGWLVTWKDLGAQQRMAEELARLTGEVGSLMRASREGVLVTDLQGEVRTYNPAFAQLCGLPEAPVRGVDSVAVHEAIRALLPWPVDYPNQLRQRMQAAAGPSAEPITDRLTCTDGRILDRRLVPQYGQGRIVGWIQHWSDQTEAVAAQTRLRLATHVFDSAMDAILVLDAQGRVLAANAAAEHLSGRSAGTLLTTCIPDLLSEQAQQVGTTPLPWMSARPTRWEGQLWLHRASGRCVPVQVSLIQGLEPGLSPMGNGVAPAGIVMLRDLSEREAWQQRVQDLRMTDGLTALPNRRHLEALLARALQFPDTDGPATDSAPAPADATEADSASMAVLHIGLDRFKHINDTFGHHRGDEVLKEVARRLSDGLRAGDTVARLDGDQFVILLPGADAQTSELIARRLLAQIAEDFPIEHQPMNLSASIGVALSPTDGTEADTLLLHAEHAMREVKERRGGGVRFHQPQVNIDRLARMKLDHAMRRALPAGRFSLHYQPQIDLHTGRVVGAEALCRWHDTELGEVSPGRFIPVAEETGFISELGDWVLCEAVAQATRWLARGLALPVSVNVSMLQFQQTGFVERVSQVLSDASLPPHLLELELTESLLANDVQQVMTQLNRLAALGVQLAIDDFGTGYASLSYLKKLPIHRLKIDRSFVQRLPSDRSDAAITRTIVELAHALDLQVIAEGVETVEQHDHLAQVGCHQFQGYLFSRPVPAPDLEILLEPTRRQA